MSAKLGRRWRPFFVLRVAAVALTTGSALWVALGVTLTLVRGASQPDAALVIWPSGATSNAAKASRLLLSANPEAAFAPAQRALAREPVNVVAVRTLGLHAAAGGDERRARQLFAYAEALSRRDVPTQLWLIEASVAQDDIQGALRHYDRALRTSRAVGDQLLPILARASSDPAIADPLSRLLATRPPWASSLFGTLLSDESTSPATLALILRRMAIRPGDEYGWLLSGGLSRLVAAGEIEMAHAIYQEARGGGARRELLRNGDFSLQHPIPPFEWWLRDEPDLAAVITRGENVPRLSILAGQGRSGEVARQLVLLPPGAYRLAATVGETPSEESARPDIAVVCADGTELARSHFPPAVASARLTLRFLVPSTACGTQWIKIESAPSGRQARDLQPWITSVSLEREHGVR